MARLLELALELADAALEIARWWIGRDEARLELAQAAPELLELLGVALHGRIAELTCTPSGVLTLSRCSSVK
ncbi:MAG: hypothetical protein AB1486_33400 [Planctomycetota bacterium]